MLKIQIQFCPLLTHLSFLFVIPSSQRDDDLEDDEDLAQAETYADYVPMKRESPLSPLPHHTCQL